VHRYRGRTLDGERLQLELYRDDSSLRFTFDINRAAFNLSAKECELPFGLKIPLHLFFALFDGGCQIWDLAMSQTVTQWFVGKPANSPLAFLFSYFSETVNPTYLSSFLSGFGEDQSTARRQSS
jgi:hypothetical protein